MRFNHFFSLLFMAAISNGYAGSMGSHSIEKNNLYLKVFAGATFADKQTVQVRIHDIAFPSEVLDYEGAGSLYGIGLGYRWPVRNDFGLRLEAEASHSNIKIKRIRYDGLSNNGLDYNRTVQNALLANAYVDYHCNKLVPYLGAGIGGARSATVYTLRNTQALNPRYGVSNNFAWQAILGSSYRLTDRVSMGLEYRYRDLGTNNFHQTTEDGVLYGRFRNLKNTSNNVLLTLEVILDGGNLS